MAHGWILEQAQTLTRDLESRLPKHTNPPPMTTHSEPQPIHTVYGGAHLFRRETCLKLQAKAQESFAKHAPDVGQFAQILDIKSSSPENQEWLVSRVFERVAAKLKNNPVEDFRIDFEDGFGPRPDSEEDATSLKAADEVAEALRSKLLPPRIGIRIKSFNGPTRSRAIRTLTFFVTRLVSQAHGQLPAPFIVTLPKVENAEQLQELDLILSGLEQHLGIANKTIRVEFMVESTRILLDTVRGICPLGNVVKAGGGRVLGAHLGAFDLTAMCDVPAPFQNLEHPLCVMTRCMMKFALEDQGIELADGTTNMLPIGDATTVRQAWRETYRQVTRALGEGFYQGWDLHPAQIPPRYAAVYSFYLDNLASATIRLKNFLEAAAQASRVGAHFDDAASGQGLLNFFRRGYSSSALTREDLMNAGLTPESLNTKSFASLIKELKK